MAIREDAQPNQDTLFPNQEPALRMNDPERIEPFDNWAFGDVLEDTRLDATTRPMVASPPGAPEFTHGVLALPRIRR